jgi:glc operon protein GlcG
MIRTLLVAGAAAGLSIVPAAAAPAAPPDDAILRLGDAQSIAARAQHAATEKQMNVAIVIVNREGRVIVAQRMDDASFMNMALAEAKAATAAATGVQTSLLEAAVDQGKPSLLSVPGAAMIGGGVPIVRADRIVGAIGVSGGSPKDDESVATSSLGPRE